MLKMLHRVLWAIAILALPLAAIAAENFPPPEFTTGYKLPTMSIPAPRALSWDYIDVGVLALALVVMSYLVLWRRSRRGVAILSVMSLAYFGFVRHGCVCPVGSIQNVALAIADHNYSLPAVVGAFFVLPLVFSLVSGRVFCAGVCPLGAAQDVVLLSPVKVPKNVAAVLSLIPWVYLGAAVLFATAGSTFLICRYDPFVPIFRFGGRTEMITAAAVILLLSTVVGRPFCRFLCPYSVLLRLLSPLTRWRVRVTPAQCIQCRMCENACPLGEIRFPTPEMPPDRIRSGKRMLVVTLIALPILMAAGWFCGKWAGRGLALVDPSVRLAQRIWAEDTKKVKGTVFESEWARKLPNYTPDLYKSALSISTKVKAGSALFGGWIGLVIGCQLVGLTIRRRRTDYEADASGCISCGRCYMSCPVERARLGDPDALKMLEEQP